MNKILLFTVACLLAISFTQAQQKNNQMPGQSKEKMSNLLQKAFTDKESLVPKFKINKQNQRSIIWNFDTLVFYDSTNIEKNKYIRTFNNLGDIITQTFQLWQNKPFVF